MKSCEVGKVHCDFASKPELHFCSKTKYLVKGNYTINKARLMDSSSILLQIILVSNNMRV